DFHALWCGPCKAMTPKFAAFSEQFTSAKFIKLDIDESREAASKAGVRSLPTFQIYKKGEKVDEIVGADPAGLEKAI
ncbi:thioredoxin-like protein, partial [Blyttiomyces helicus]